MTFYRQLKKTTHLVKKIILILMFFETRPTLTPDTVRFGLCAEILSVPTNCNDAEINDYNNT
jgi:hypothetical protein